MHQLIKTEKEINSMREGGHVLKRTLLILKEQTKPGMSTKDLADIAKTELKKAEMKPAFFGYHGFPDVLCTSINDEVVHGIPSKKRIITNGDIVSLDFGVIHEGMITDGAITFCVGNVSDEVKRLVNKTEESLKVGINKLKHGIDTGTLGASIQKVLEDAGLGIVRTFVGHGVGHQLHDYPEVPNYGRPGEGVELLAGMTIAVEPMATIEGEEVMIDADGWTVRTKDKSLSAHFEDTILITKNGAEVLTRA